MREVHVTAEQSGQRSPLRQPSPDLVLSDGRLVLVEPVNLIEALNLQRAVAPLAIEPDYLPTRPKPRPEQKNLTVTSERLSHTSPRQKRVHQRP